MADVPKLLYQVAQAGKETLEMKQRAEKWLVPLDTVIARLTAMRADIAAGITGIDAALAAATAELLSTAPSTWDPLVVQAHGNALDAARSATRAAINEANELLRQHEGWLKKQGAPLP